MTEIEIFWARVKRLIKQKNTTQKKVAQYCGFSVNTFKGWMSKGIFPTVIDAYYIARSLGVSLDYLAAGKEKKENKNKKRIENISLLLNKAKAELQKIG
jgi:transcriptional regulator with XRE-family HTH domain